MSIEIDEKTQKAVNPERIQQDSNRRLVFLGVTVVVLIAVAVVLKVNGVL